MEINQNNQLQLATTKFNVPERAKAVRKMMWKAEYRQFNSYKSFREIYDSDDTILEAIFQARLRKSPANCICGNSIATYYKRVYNKPAYFCRLCNNRIYPLKDTPLARTHLPLTFIFECIYKTLNAKHGITSAEIAREYGLKYDTAYGMLERTRRWMSIANESTEFLPHEDIEIDETHIYFSTPEGRKKLENLTAGGKRPKLKRGLGSQRICHVITIVGRESGVARSFQTKQLSTQVIVKFMQDAGVAKTNPIKTDESKLYASLTKLGYNHSACLHKKKQWVGENDAHTNTVEGLNHLMKGSYYNVHRGLYRKYIQSYVDRTVFEFSTRHQSFLEAINKLLSVLPPILY